ncbi:MAG: TIR domain-containing protein [Phototrophicaceae bacterium]
MPNTDFSDVFDVFISYRRVNVEFAKRLHQALTENGKEVWIDWEDIPPGSASFDEDIKHGLEGSTVFLCVLTPAYLQSSYCIELELNYALSLNKKIIPIVLEEFDANQAPSAVGHINWIYFIPHTGQENTFEQSIAKVIQALETDQDHLRAHRRFLMRALEWDNQTRKDSYLLNGEEIDLAEQWLIQSMGKNPPSTELHRQYIRRSRQMEDRRRRQVLTGVIFALVVSLILAILSAVGFSTARVAEAEAIAQAQRAEDNASTADAAQAEAWIQANNAATQAQVAGENAATATVAQGEAIIQADNAATQAQVARNNAATATVAQGEAIIQADNAATQAQVARNNAATATIAQGEAVIQADNAQRNAATAQAAQATSEFNADLANTNATAVAIQRNEAQSIALSAYSELQSERDPVKAAWLALIAIEDYAPTWEAERTLAEVIEPYLIVAELKGHSLSTPRVAWQPNSNEVLLSASWDATAQLWNTNIAGRSQRYTGMANQLPQASWEPNQTRFFVSSEQGGLSVYDATNPMRPLFTWSGGRVVSAVWHPMGGQVALVDQRGRVGSWQLADETTQWVGEMDSETAFPVLKWSTDGQDLIHSVDDSTLALVSMSNPTAPRTFTASALLTDALMVNAQQLIASGSNGFLYSWDVPSGDMLYQVKHHIQAVNGIRLATDGQRLASFSADHSIRIWEVSTGEELRVLLGHTNDVTDVAWSPNGNYLASVGADRTLQIWNVQMNSLPIIFNPHRNTIYDVEWSSDGSRLATASRDATVNVFSFWGSADELVDIARGCCLTRELTTEERLRYDLPIPTTAPPPSDIESCPTAQLPSRLYPRAFGTVTTDENLDPLNIRQDPSVLSAIMNTIVPSQEFYVLAGPTCNEGIAWFKIAYGFDSQVGWIAEGTSYYFVEPIVR